MRTGLRLGTNSAILILIIGALICGFGVRLAVQVLRADSLPARARGTVISLQGSPGRAGATVYLPLIRVATTGSQSFTFTDRSANGHNVGDTVPVAYDPKDPAGSARLVPGGWALPTAILVAIVGGAMLAFVVTVQRRQFRRRASMKEIARADMARDARERAAAALEEADDDEAGDAASDDADENGPLGV